MNAWLITWEGTGNDERLKSKVVYVLNPEKSPQQVAELVETLYIFTTASLDECAAYAANPEQIPYKAQITQGRVICGPNPYLEGRPVKDLFVKSSSDHHQEIITWKEQMASGEWKEQTVTQKRKL